MRNIRFSIVGAAAVCATGGLLEAAPVPLQNATAQVSQGGYEIDAAIDGLFPVTSCCSEGWANNGANAGNIATFETVTDTPAGTSTNLTFQLFSGGYAIHTLGKFRISATTADRSLFADGNNNGGGSVGTEAIWTILDPISKTSDGSSTFSEDANNIVLTANPSELETYTITASTTLTGITGFRLEAFTDASLGNGHGPGWGSNGNYVVREFSVDAVAVPEPTSLGLLSLGGLLTLRRKR